MQAEGLTDSPANYEFDHRLPLELGGAPSDPLNLSPQPHPESFVKDTDENSAKARVCAGADLRQVQAEFIQTWLGAYPTYKR